MASDNDDYIFQFIERDDGTRLLRDQTGGELDMSAAEAACEKREVDITITRPSVQEQERNRQREADAFSVYECYGIRSNDPTERIDVILTQNGFELGRAEPQIGEAVKVLRGMLANRDLLGAAL